MTSTADTTQHPDVSEISDLTEGLLSPSRSAAVRLHLDGCPLCADVRASLEEIRGLLGTLPGPPRMPAEIAGRIDAALAAEALLNATAPGAVPDVSRETSPARPAPAAPASARPAGRPSAASGPGRPRRARRRRVAALGAVFGAAALGLSLFFVQSGALNLGGAGDTDKRSDAAISAADSARFDGEPVPATVQALLQQNAGTFKVPQDQPAPESLTTEGDDGQKRSLPVTLPDCVKAATGRGEAVLAFRQGEFQGMPAYLLVLPDTADGTRVQAYVVDASCATGGGKTEGTVLLQESVPRS
ncbi:anti-sigma factor [Streptomyces roseicoloratus]|uniref:Anti-sigma factor n=1 Tax=Streptomyces roseicoloratus TaxID=2508722 RepID=A0ABY9RWE0_9ACTN|nr:anti-sigma factor [Streptomyces roseicoloratus]WMX46084.1 anti-sigma factor [Streptomyces roseicoloratus]